MEFALTVIVPIAALILLKTSIIPLASFWIIIAACYLLTLVTLLSNSNKIKPSKNHKEVLSLFKTNLESKLETNLQPVNTPQP